MHGVGGTRVPSATQATKLNQQVRRAPEAPGIFVTLSLLFPSAFGVSCKFLLISNLTWNHKEKEICGKISSLAQLTP